VGHDEFVTHPADRGHRSEGVVFLPTQAAPVRRIVEP